MIVFGALILNTIVAHAVDSAIAIYKSHDCASVERPLLLVPGTDVLDGNCISLSDLDANSIQVVSLACECYVIAYTDDNCEYDVAVAEHHECVMLKFNMRFKSISVHSTSGGDCIIPDEAVRSPSAKVPPALSSKIVEPMDPDMSMPTATASCSRTSGQTSETATPTKSIAGPTSRLVSSVKSSNLPTTHPPTGSPTPDPPKDLSAPDVLVVICISLLASASVLGIGILAVRCVSGRIPMQAWANNIAGGNSRVHYGNAYFRYYVLRGLKHFPGFGPDLDERHVSTPDETTPLITGDDISDAGTADGDEVTNRMQDSG